VTPILNAIRDAAHHIPNQVWAALLGVLLIGTAVTFPLARRRAYLAGQRAAGHPINVDRRDRALFIAALVPGVLFLAAVLTGSGRGLIGTGRDNLHWHHGWEYLVPATLDGVGIAFAFLAFRAVRRRRSPDRSVRVAWGAAIASGVMNFGHETSLPGGSALGGGYLAFLSLMVMVMFHELLDQFTEGTAWIKRENPAFKLRWLTWPTNTACAWVAWRNWPPADGTSATVAAAVAHLDRVRSTKRDLRRLRDLEVVATGVPSWTRAVPWARARMLGAALADERSTREAERSDWAERLAAVEAEQASGAARTERLIAEAEQQAEQHRLEAVHLAEQLEAERAERAAVRDRVGSAERAREVAEQALHTVQNTLSVERELRERAEQSTAMPGKTPRSAAAPNAPRLTDDEALRALLRAHPERGYEWTKREVHRITGAGFGRVDRLIAAIAEHHRSTPQRSGAEHPDGDDKEVAG
jgi:hypothetical protein